MTDLRRHFTDQPHLRAVVDGALQGRVGRVVEGRGAARLDVGVYRLFGGAVDAALFEGLEAGCELVFAPDASAWPRAAEDRFGARLEPRDMTGFDGTAIDPGHVRSLRSDVDGIEFAATGAADFDGLDAALAPNRPANFGDADAFAHFGFGTLARDGSTIACAATTYATSTERAEIAIATRPSHRRRGLALATAARIVAQALERELEPCWNAANDVSVRVAERLGFRPTGRVRVYDLR